MQVVLRYLILFVAFALGCDRSEKAEKPEMLVGTALGEWRFDVERTTNHPKNGDIPDVLLDDFTWQWGIQARRGFDLSPDGIYTQWNREQGIDLYYQVLRQNERFFTIRVFSGDPNSGEFIQAIEIENGDSLITKTKGEEYIYWSVYTKRDDAWESAKSDALAAPPLVFTSYYVDDADAQKKEVEEWLQQEAVVSEVRLAVNDWIRSGEAYFTSSVTNENSGAQYEVTGIKNNFMLRVKIRFLGNDNWDQK